ncbi:MAG: pyruvate/oxaloacetate carboxyltransferase [Crocinitomicaceae bacterium]|jgi:pyruvate/oxaloacetate carboxyltransferase
MVFSMNETFRPKLINLTMRDGQQSTLDAADWLFESYDYAKFIAACRKAGFEGAEVSGGQSFQIAINRGYNPFIVLGALSHGLLKAESDGEFELQMLFRGANALGFRHYDKDVIEIILHEFIKHGITKIRFFDALNDIENLELPESIKAADGVTLEGAICFTHYSEAPARYSDTYFCRYAEALIDAGYNAIAIKDMSGQLTADRVASLVPSLLTILTPKGIPLSLHCHSTNEGSSKSTIRKAISYGIHAIETVEGVLSGGSAHHALSTVAPELITDSTAYQQLTQKTTQLWGTKPVRRDQDIPQLLKEQLCAAGVPGGAMPFVIRDLKQQESAIRAKYLASSKSSKNPDEAKDIDTFLAIVDVFIQELKRVCQDVGLPLLVTPTADICCKQAIMNLAMGSSPYSDSLADRYLNRSGQPNPDSRFAKLVLGYYGELKSYDDEGSVHRSPPEVVRFFEANNTLQLKATENHPSQSLGGDDLRTAQHAAWQLIQKMGANALSFASFDQLTILYAQKPAAGLHAPDPILKAVEAYCERSESAKIDGRGRTFPDYETLMGPILNCLGAMFALDPELNPRDIPNFKLKELGTNLCNRLFDIYIDLPIWARVTVLNNHLSKLLSSSHISEELKVAVRHVSETLTELDLRPIRQEKENLGEALGQFKELSINQLFNSLALINSFINDVAKYATNPKAYAERSIGISDINNLSKPAKNGLKLSPWEAHIQLSLTGKYLRLEADFVRRSELWKV